MQRRPSSPSLRYWLARLRPLARPIVWAPTSLLVVAIAGAWQLFTQPDWLTALVPSPATSDLSPEERAIAADIDTLPLLLNDFGLTVPGLATDEKPNSDQAANKPPEALSSIPLLGGAQEPAALPSASVAAPLGGLGDNNRMSLGSNAAGAAAELPSFSLLQPPSPSTPSALATALSQGNAPVNQSALAAALARYAGGSGALPVVARSPLEGTTGLNGSQVNQWGNLSPSQLPSQLVEGTTSLNNSVPLTPTSNAFGNLTGNQAPSALPPQVPTGLVPNPAPVGAVNNFGAAPSLPNPAGLPIAPAAPPDQAAVNPQPFSVPRSVPGRTIGGGNINTFSNP